MPELPEVEQVARNLKNIIQPPAKIVGWVFARKDLRFPLQQNELHKLVGLQIHKIERRAKYILLSVGESHILIFHLGMTGQWRVASGDQRKHDHVSLKLNVLGQSIELIYEDPRRFGFIQIISVAQLGQRFKDLGVEPLDPQTNWDFITAQFKKFNSPIKSAIMDQKKIVGVGNIYASEALFRAGIYPMKSCAKISSKKYAKLWAEIRNVLSEAIEKGGSTISSFQNSYGEKGNFQNNFFVYDLAGQLCKICRKSKIKQTKILGRSTFWCPTCQKS